MRSNFTKLFLMVFLFLQNGYSQSLEDRLSGIFTDLLELNLVGSPGQHGEHFKPANVAASATIINSLNNFIGTSVSSFPLSSTVAGLTFDFSSGRPVSTSTSLGPIFSERAQTLGQGLLNVGFNFTYMNFTKIRGLDTKDLRLAFTHQDVGLPGMGDSPNEFDYIDMYLNMELKASILAFYFTYGLTDRLDISVALPLVNVNLKATPVAYMNSYTFVNNDTANHNFGDDPTHPLLQTNPPAIDDDATGIGDIAIRAKYNFISKQDVDLSALVEYRLATGEAADFLGAGQSRLRFLMIASKAYGDFTPHLNLGYEMKNSDKDPDDFEVYLGYDQKLSESLTFALDFIGEFEVGSQSDELSFPDPIIVERPDGTYKQRISYTNLPNQSNDNIINGAVGFKLQPKENLMVIANVFFPLNDGGLRADFIPTFGVEFSF